MKIVGIASAACQRAPSQLMLQYAANSLRSASSESKESNYDMDIIKVGQLPIYDGVKYKSELFYPDIVLDFHDKLRNCDAVLFSSNECEHGHYYSISGAMQNAIDWGLVPDNLFYNKACAFISHGGGFEGPSCFHLRIQCLYLGLHEVKTMNQSLSMPNIEIENMSTDVGTAPDDMVKKYINDALQSLSLSVFTENPFKIRLAKLDPPLILRNIEENNIRISDNWYGFV